MLSDPKQREEYDAIRQMAHGGARFTAGGPGGNGGFEDIFSAFGGGGRQRVRFYTGGGVAHGGYAGAGADIDDLLVADVRGPPPARARRGARDGADPFCRLRRAARPAQGRRRPGADDAAASATPSRAPR